MVGWKLLWGSSLTKLGGVVGRSFKSVAGEALCLKGFWLLRFLVVTNWSQGRSDLHRYFYYFDTTQLSQIKGNLAQHWLYISGTVSRFTPASIFAANYPWKISETAPRHHDRASLPSVRSTCHVRSSGDRPILTSSKLSGRGVDKFATILQLNYRIIWLIRYGKKYYEIRTVVNSHANNILFGHPLGNSPP